MWDIGLNVIWKAGVITLQPIEDPPEMQQIDNNTVRLVINPWTATSAICNLNTDALKYTRGRDFPDYYEQLYAENVIW